MKNLLLISIILLSLLSLSAASFAQDDIPLFGEYPAKHLCIKVNYDVATCKVPTLKQIDKEISNYRSTLGEREEMLNDYMRQHDSYKEQLLAIANEKELEIGRNSFSRLYRAYVNNLDEMLGKYTAKALGLHLVGTGSYGKLTFPKDLWDNMKELISNDESTSYLKLLNEVRDIVVDGGDEEMYANKVFSYKFSSKERDFNKVMEILKTRISRGQHFRFSFTDMIKMNRSCTKVKGYGKYMKHKVSMEFLEVHPDADFGFDLIDDQELLETLLTGNNNKPIEVNCVKVKKGTSIDPKFDKQKGKLTIPYRVKRGFGRHPDLLQPEFTKEVVIKNRGYFLKYLRARFLW